MIGRVYTWRGEHWVVLTRWRGAGPRNVLLERVEPCDPPTSAEETGAHVEADGRWYRRTGDTVVRPFRGLRKPS